MKEKFMSDSSNEDSFYGDFAHHDRELPNEDTINEGFYYKIDWELLNLDSICGLTLKWFGLYFVFLLSKNV